MKRGGCEHCEELSDRLKRYEQLLKMAITYDPMVDPYKIKELLKKFKRTLVEAEKGDV